MEQTLLQAAVILIDLLNSSSQGDVEFDALTLNGVDSDCNTPAVATACNYDWQMMVHHATGFGAGNCLNVNAVGR